MDLNQPEGGPARSSSGRKTFELVNSMTDFESCWHCNLEADRLRFSSPLAPSSQNEKLKPEAPRSFGSRGIEALVVATHF